MNKTAVLEGEDLVVVDNERLVTTIVAPGRGSFMGWLINSCVV